MGILGPSQQIMEAALQLRSARGELLAGNVANADTPGYRVVDIDFDRALQSAMAKNEDQAEFATKITTLENLRYDGNDVDGSQELAKAYENSLGYVATLKLYGDSVERIKSALSSS
ncbi:MAG: flagellar basal body rod protein FlgB [Deltaproteobacteria bacterium]|nr:flagellar basal body rod protein FlgB [Deltaproteobacteria bacterium]MBV8451486.1 flagellar basal body rod protein FlgB [Deltaproteobacteria bacterium]